ncbi:phage head-tail joining protein [Jiella sp. M17.18]|uniref:phage head-tail joining protein n=1 Tax=Jiella sp. M17.18 TaxID=3234247 RepID=UPI0034DF952E
MAADELNAKRAALVAARSSGETRVIFHSGGTRREIEYRSVAEIERAIGAIDRDLAAAAGRRPIRTFLPVFSRGL